MPEQMAKPLSLATPENIRQELGLVDPQTIRADAAHDEELETAARELVQKLVASGAEGSDMRDRLKAAIETMGLGTQHDAARLMRMLDGPLHELAGRGEEGGPVAGALMDLKTEVEKLDPSQLTFKTGWFSRLLGWFPGIKNPFKRYFSRYESSKMVIDAILHSLQGNRKQLSRDNRILIEDQKRMREATLRLEKVIKLGRLIEQKLAYELDWDIVMDETRRLFLEEELLFPLRQRIIDLQQQLAVNQQGIMAMEIIIRNNKELIRGIDRTQNVTLHALQVASTVAMALAQQKTTVEKINAVDRATSDLISHTAQQLRSQAAQIHKQASTGHLDVDTLKEAFTDIRSTMEDISRYRQEALPLMANTILDMNRMTSQSEQSIRNLEQRGHLRNAAFTIDVEKV